jgi:hypothetical protein
MMIATLVTAVKICGLPMFTTRMSTAATPISTAGTTGVLRLGSIFASRAPAGRALSRAIANISRIAAVCTASRQTITAMTDGDQEDAMPSGPPSDRPAAT